MSFPLTAEQRAVVEARGGGLLVSAAAGSGKTRVLVERLLARVADEGRSIDEFLVITFTNAAAAELRSRVAEELAVRLAEQPAQLHLRRQTTLLYQTQISTIHALCMEILREFGHLLDLDPDWRLCDDGEAAVLRRRALEGLLEARYEGMEPGGDFSVLVDTMSAGLNDERLQEIVLDVYGRIQSHRDPARWLEEQRGLFGLRGVTDVGQTPWGGLLLDEVGRGAAYWAGRMEDTAALCRADEKLERGYLPSLTATAAALRRVAAASASGRWDEAAALLGGGLFSRLSPVRDCERPDLQERVKAVRGACKKRVEKLAALLDGSSDELLADLREVYPAVRGLFDLVADFSATYAAEKARRGVLDFGDLEHLTVALLVGEDGAPTALAEGLQARWTELMVDEYQDTNEVQNVIFSALSRREENLFLVGDVKQSIYRFRLAEPEIFLRKYREFPLFDGTEASGPRKMLLSKNFRSRPEVLAAVNDLFENVMSTEMGGMDYGAEERLYAGRTEPPVSDCRTELTVLDLRGVQTGGAEDAPDRHLIEARVTAGRIRALLDAGFLLSGDPPRPAVPADFAILMRSVGPVLHHYIRALAERGIPWQTDGGGEFFGSAEVSCALSLLEILDNPRQDVPLIAALRSPVFGFSADRLAGIRARAPAGGFYDAVQADGGEDCREFLVWLDGLRFGAADRSSHQLLWELYAETNLLGLYGAMEGGDERRGNLLALYELARQFEGSGHRGLYGFLSHLARLRESGAALRGPVAGGARGGVTIQTIHRSKGLEYPVVLLCGLGKRFNTQDETAPMLFHKELGLGPKGLDLERGIQYPTVARTAIARKLNGEMRAEELRLLYVAMTRAREKLILTCTIGRNDKGPEGLTDAAWCPAEPQEMAAARSMAEWLMAHALCRPEGAALRSAAGMELPDCGYAFGPAWEIRYSAGNPSVAQGGLEDDSAAADMPDASTSPAAPDPEAVAALRDALRWRYPHAAAADTPSKLTATQLKGRTLDSEVTDDAPPAPPPAAPLRRPRLDGEEPPMTPAERGTALHLMLQFMDFSQTGSEEALTREAMRLTDRRVLTERQGRAVDVARLRAFFASPLGRELLASDSLRREFKFSLLAPAERYYPGVGAGEEVLLQGVIDCWYDTPEGLVVLDFKTDRVTRETVAARAEAYRAQITAYGDALAQMTGRVVKKRVLWFFALDCEWIF